MTSGGRWYVIASVLAGLAVGFGVGAIVFSGGSKSSVRTSVVTTTGTVSTEPIKLPATLGQFKDISAVIASKQPGSSLARGTSANEAKVGASTVAAYRRAYGGAAVAYRRYTDGGLVREVYAIAVRASAPGLTIGPVIDPSYLGLATPPREVKAVGSVSCEVDWGPVVAAGTKPLPANEHIAACERSTSGITVFVGGSGFTGPTGLNTMAQVANDAWSAASAG